MSPIDRCIALVKETWVTPEKWQVNYSIAEKVLREELTHNNSDVTLLTCLGAVLCDQAKHDEAQSYLEAAVTLGSVDRNTYFNLGVALLNTSTHENAMRYFNKAQQFKASPHSLEAYFDPQAQ